MKKVLLYIAIFILNFNIVFANEPTSDLEFYTSVHPGIKLPVYNTNQYKIRFYTFVDELSCYTCIKSIINLSEYVDSFKNVEIVLFLQSDDFDLSKNNLVKEGWKYKIINDKIGAYKKLFGVKNNPVSFVMNNTGIVQFIGVPGSAALFNIGKFKKAVNELSRIELNYSKDLHTDLPLYKSVPLNKNGFTEIGKIIQATIFIDSSYYLLWSFQSKKLFVYNFNGDFIQVKDFSDFHHPVFTFSSSYNKKIIFSDFDEKYNLIFYTYDLIKDTIEFLYKKKPKGNYYPLYTYVLINDSILVNGYWLNKKMLSDSSSRAHAFSIINLNTKKSIDAGIFDNYYYRYHLFNFYHLDFCSNNKNQIVMIQNFTDSLRFYDVKGNYLNSIYIDYDKRYYFYQWKNVFANLNEKSNIEDFKKLSDSVSNLTDSQALLFDKKKNTYYIIYRKYYRNTANKKTYGYYIHCVPSKHKDFYLGNNKPFYVDNGKIYCVKKTEDEILINIFSI